MAAAFRVGWLDSGATRRRGLIANRSPTALTFLRTAIFQESSKCFGSPVPRDVRPGDGRRSTRVSALRYG